LAAHIEATMLGMVSLATARATFTRHWLNKLKEWTAKDLPTADDELLYNTAQWLIHDFGMRASSCPEESLLFGLAHLLSFHGTDTFNAAFVASKLGAKSFSGKSLHALAHRNVQGFEQEQDSFIALHKESNKCNTNIASYVSDCYNFQDAVATHLVNLADKYPQDTFVSRPDSGDALKNILFILQQGRKNIRYIEGNGQKPKSMFAVLQGLLDAGFKCTQHGIFGVGGESRNQATRDAMSSKWALSNTGGREVVKLSEDFGKLTVPGPNIVLKTKQGMKVFFEQDDVYYTDGGIAMNMLEVYYTCNKSGPTYTFNCYEKFSDQQDRCIKQFDSYAEFAKANPNYGLERECLSDAIKKVQDDTFAKYRNAV